MLARIFYGMFLVLLGCIIGSVTAQGEISHAIIPALAAILMIALDAIFE